MFGQDSKESKEEKVEEKEETPKPQKNAKVVWLKLDGESEIELADTPNLAKKAEELGWTKKDDK